MIEPKFSGETYVPTHDEERLGKQLRRTYLVMRDGEWRTLSEISAITGDPAASISARLRDLRKPEFGDYNVERRARGPRSEGLFEYRVTEGSVLKVPETLGKKRRSGYALGFIAAARILAAAKDLAGAKSAIRKELEKLI